MHYIFKIVVFVYLTANVDGEYYKPEGSTCEWENITGICVDARKCTTFEIDLEEKKTPPICSYKERIPIVCCTACNILNSTELELRELEKPHYLTTGVKHVDKCAKYYRNLDYACKPHVTSWMDKILVTTLKRNKCYAVAYGAVAPAGGEDAQRGQYPHMALLGYGKDVKSAQWLCGGSIISERFILTAGHCRSHIQLGPVRYAALGILKRSDPPEYWHQYTVKQFISHPEYHPPSKYNDIALIETATRITFNDEVLPACIYGENIEEDTAFATGWGGLGHNRENADTLQEVALQRYTASECSQLYPQHRHLVNGYDHKTQMCYGNHHVVKDTCGGDSGGPLQLINEQSRTCIKHIIGVTSYGRACGFAGQAGMYTRVQHYVSWIESLVWP